MEFNSFHKKSTQKFKEFLYHSKWPEIRDASFWNRKEIEKDNKSYKKLLDYSTLRHFSFKDISVDDEKFKMLFNLIASSKTFSARCWHRQGLIWWQQRATLKTHKVDDFNFHDWRTFALNRNKFPFFVFISLKRVTVFGGSWEMAETLIIKIITLSK